MKVCGIELKGNDAVLVCLEGDAEKYHLIHEEKKKLTLDDSGNQLDVISFSSKIRSFLEGKEFDEVGIKARATKGRFSGGATSFKMEGLIQNSNVNVEVIHAATIKAKLKNLGEESDNVKVLAYQKEALQVALYLLNQSK